MNRLADTAAGAGAGSVGRGLVR